MDKIDFVILWVDGSDREWREEKRKYDNSGSDDRDERYRDWDVLRYWFRAVENYTPWVNHIFFVTYGHLPKWLNTNNKKLTIVKHSDFIPQKYLPTFSSHAIELNLHRIKGLSEHFVYFNDDMFVLRPTGPELFFKNGLPCDTAVLNALCFKRIPDSKLLFMIPAYDMVLINSNFDKKQTIKDKVFNWFNPKYGKDLLRTIALMPWRHFPGFALYHLPYSWNKSVLEEIWEKEGDVLNETCSHKFRVSSDVNSWLVSYWQFATNQFYPRSPKIGTQISLKNSGNENIYEIIRKQKYTLCCINDAVVDPSKFEAIKVKLQESFDTILPQKSTFEV